MLSHYFKIAVRNLARHRLHTGVSVVVLALGLACFLAAYLAVSYLRGYDRHFVNADRSYVIFQGMHGAKNGFDFPSYPFSSVLLAEQLAADVPELEAVARYRQFGGSVIVDGETQQRPMAAAEPKFLEIFDFQVVAGDLRAALVGRNAIITAGAAQVLFGTTDVAGRTVTVRGTGSGDVTLAAVIADLPQASIFSRRGLWTQGFELLVPWDALATISPVQNGGWFNTMVATFALAPADRSLPVSELDRRLAQLVKSHVPPDSGIDVHLDAKPVSAMAAGIMQSQVQGMQGSVWRVDVLTSLLLFAATVLAVACVNFVNLATARAAARTREIGVRKAVGAGSPQVVGQELFQTAVIACVSVALAMAAFAALRGLVPPPWGLAFGIPWREPRLWVFLAALVAAVTLLAGLYPALVLARVRPMTALRTGTMRVGAGVLRALLVGAQFALASFLVISVVVVYAQRDNLHETLLGRFADPYVIVLPGSQAPTGIDLDVVGTELKTAPGVKAVTTTGNFPWQFAGSRQRYSARPGEDQAMIMPEQTIVGYDYFEVLEVPLLAGRAFARDRNDVLARTQAERAARSTPTPVILDRRAARALGWASPADAIGKPIYMQGDARGVFEIAGVVESVPTAVRERGSDGVVYMLVPSAAAFTIVRIGKDQVQTALEHIDDVFKKLSTSGTPRPRMFLDQAFENAYSTFALINMVFVALGAFAIAIAAVGLFGMASYITSRRTREIGLRKTQGASSRQILVLLLASFAKPVVIANLIVWPFAFVAAQRYLGGFAQRIELTPWPFVAALLATLLVACAAVCGRVLHAARLRPTEALREE
ncbi:MAG TPA: FtsX-like permease family protein [Gammaproteobacteria bacterium]|nr:FtsX-like permease family protein [Gammaproteobacteria bacterium]